MIQVKTGARTQGCKISFVGGSQEIDSLLLTNIAGDNKVQKDILMICSVICTMNWGPVL